MNDSEASIHILPQKRTLSAYRGEQLMETLIRHSIFLKSDCGGNGRCHKCRVDKISEDGNIESVDACRQRVESDLSIKIPASSMASSHIMGKARLLFPRSFEERRKAEKSSKGYGIAVDLGTTTIAIYLCDLALGAVTDSVAVKNNQSLCGDDVMSRITAITENSENLGKLHDLVISSIEWGIRALFSDLKKNPDLLQCMVVVGNPTMIHIFAGKDPSSIGISPFQPIFYDAECFFSKQLKFGFKNIPVQTLPNVSGFIGGDTLAAAVAVDIEEQPDATLLIDLGTNGELVLKAGNRLYATSCATGPAFEGATLSCGMQGIPGAINAIEITPDRKLASFSIINPSGKPGLKPVGICGTGIINSIARLYQNGVIRPDGAFSDGSDKFILVPADTAAGQMPIYISQKDIRSVQLGKSALISGIEFLLRRAGLDLPEKIIIAGSMGSHVRTDDLICLGMIPQIKNIEIAGNLAGSGAVMALCDEHYINKAVGLSKKMEIIELAADAKFQNVFIDNLGFPGKAAEC
jgi:uncharacterized 2Fe-2S/4Fe-4S cluster protein (DUF4445 family)